MGKKEYGVAIKNELRRKHMTMKELAEKCGHGSYQWVTTYATGRCLPKVDAMLQIERALGWPLMEQISIAYSNVELPFPPLMDDMRVVRVPEKTYQTIHAFAKERGIGYVDAIEQIVQLATDIIETAKGR